MKEMFNETRLQKREQSIQNIPERLYGSIDAAKVRIEPRTKQGKVDESREDWRDMKVGCWYEGETVPVNQRSVRQKEKAQREGTIFRAKNKRYFCDVAESEQFGKLVWATGCSACADCARELVFVCDGAVWIWNLVAQYYPNAIQIVDWYHAEDRLKRIADETFPIFEEHDAWLKKNYRRFVARQH